MARGSKPGERRGGRQKGTLNTRTREIAEAALADGMTPLDYLLTVMRDTKAEGAQRLDAAKAAAPYVHPRLSSVEAKVEGDLTLAVTRVELVGLE